MNLHLFRTALAVMVMGLLMPIWVVPTFAQDPPTQISIRVDGLSCPFCAYGLEKKLKKLEGTEKVRIDIEKGIAEITVAEGKTIAEEDLNKAVEDAGFSPREITYRSALPQ